MAPTTVYSTALSGGYVSDFELTSASSPQVAAVAALVRGMNPDLSYTGTEDVLTSTADKIGPYAYVNGYHKEVGYGRLNAYRAVRRAVELRSDFSYGDVNSSSSVTDTDGDMVLEHSAGLITLTGPGWVAAEVSANDEITSFDASLIYQYVDQVISCFPADCASKAGASVAQFADSVDETEVVLLPGDLSDTLAFYLNHGGGQLFSLDIAVTGKFVGADRIAFNLPSSWRSSYRQDADRAMIALAGSVPLDEGLFLQLIRDKGRAGVVRCRLRLNDGQVHDAGEFIMGEAMSIRPGASAVLGSYPNPFNPSTQINYYLNEPADVLVQVYDLTGRLLSVLDRGQKAVGLHTATFNGAHLSSGTYFVRLGVQSERGRIDEYVKPILLAK